MSPTSRRRLLVLTLLAGWAAIVGAAAGKATTTPTWTGWSGFGTFLTIVAAVLALVGVGLLIAMALAGRQGSDSEPRARRSVWRDLLVIVLLLILVRLLRSSDGSVETPSGEEIIDPDVPIPDVSLDDVITLVGLLLIAVCVAVWARRQRGRLPSTLHDSDSKNVVAADLDPLVKAAAQQLRLGSDDRSAVLRAYAGFEESLTAKGHARQSAETPTEHVQRLMVGLPLDAAPVLRLAELYEMARFSDHSVTPEDRRVAADALDQVRRQLSASIGTSRDDVTP